MDIFSLFPPLPMTIMKINIILLSLLEIIVQL